MEIMELIAQNGVYISTVSGRKSGCIGDSGVLPAACLPVQLKITRPDLIILSGYFRKRSNN